MIWFGPRGFLLSNRLRRISDESGAWRLFPKPKSRLRNAADDSGRGFPRSPLRLEGMPRLEKRTEGPKSAQGISTPRINEASGPTPNGPDGAGAPAARTACALLAGRAGDRGCRVGRLCRALLRGPDARRHVWPCVGDQSVTSISLNPASAVRGTPPTGLAPCEMQNPQIPRSSASPAGGQPADPEITASGNTLRINTICRAFILSQ